jgi:hypothetical protein
MAATRVHSAPLTKVRTAANREVFWLASVVVM